MATWTDLSGAFGYGTTLTSSQMQQLRDNITALAEGASGAPDIRAEALDRGAGPIVVAFVPCTDEGTWDDSANDIGCTYTSNSWGDLWRGSIVVPANNPGSLRLTADIISVSGTGGSLRLNINGSTGSSITASAAGTVTGTEDISGLTVNTVYEVEIQGYANSSANIKLGGWALTFE